MHRLRIRILSGEYRTIELCELRCGKISVCDRILLIERLRKLYGWDNCGYLRK